MEGENANLGKDNQLLKSANEQLRTALEEQKKKVASLEAQLERCEAVQGKGSEHE